TLAAPVSRLRLRSLETAPWAGMNTSLLPGDDIGHAHGESLNELVERLGARLGADRVLVPVACCDHRPERMQQWVPAHLAPGPERAPRQPPLAADALYPTWLLPEPRLLPVRNGVPHYGGPLRRLARGYRVEAGWWEERGATTSSRAAKGPAWSGSTASSRRCRSSKAPPRRRSFAGTCRACMPEHHDKARPQRWQGAPPPLSAVPDGLPGYAELHALSNFSFQRGASHPGELVVRAYNLGYAAVAITDECSVAGVVRADAALKRHLAHACQLEIEAPGSPRARPFQLLFGSEFDLAGARLVAIARDLPGWGGLCEFITAARAAAPKGTYRVSWESSDFGLLQGCEILYAPRRE